MNWISRLLSFVENDDSYSKWRGFLGIGLIAGVLAILLGFDLSNRRILSAAMILSGASLFVGVLAGFLFGIPRLKRRDATPSTTLTSTGAEYLPNTNLEDISDWLTKIIIGVGLVELRNIPGHLESIARYWTASLGGSTYQSFAAGLLVYFSVIGFLLGYLWTRLALVADFLRNDPQRLISTWLERVAAASQSDPTVTERSPTRQVFTSEQVQAAQALQVVAERSRISLDHLRQQVRELAALYESLRANMPSGAERTRQMEKVASQLRSLSFVAYPLLSELVHSSSPGERLAAVTFLQARPHNDYLEWLALRLSEEKPFIGYHAAVALLNAARAATGGERELVGRAIEVALHQTGDLSNTTDRRTVLLAARDELRGLLSDD